MKSLLIVLSIITGLILTINVSASALPPGVNFTIKNGDAQVIYQTLTGVQDDGAAGHTYRNGKNVVCWRVNADMDDAQGKLIPLEDPRRYTCSMHIDNTGVITPGNKY